MWPVEALVFRGKPVATLHYNPVIKKSLDNLHLMQFTGLLDKNGKEIYEGDVFRYNDEAYKVDDMIPVHRHTHVTNIGYFDRSDKYFYRDHPAGQYDNGDDWMSWPEMYEVIGNIYEHPELVS